MDPMDQRNRPGPFLWLVVLILIILGAGVFLGLPFRSRPPRSNFATVYPSSSGLQQNTADGVRLRSMMTTNPQPEVEQYYMQRLGVQNYRVGVQSKSSPFRGREISGAVEFTIETNSYLALTRVTDQDVSTVLIEPPDSRGVRIQVIDYQFEEKAASKPITTAELPPYPQESGASTPHYRGFSFETPDQVDAVLSFYRTNLAGWKWPGLVAAGTEGGSLLAVQSNRFYFLRAVRSTNDNLTKVLFVVAGK